MPKSSFVNFKAVKAALTMEQVLQHYGLLDKFKRSPDSLSGACPIHRGDNQTQFRVSLSKHVWKCFGQCKKGGNALDFIAEIESVSIHAAALKAIEWFHLDRGSMTAKSEDHKPSSSGVAKPASNPSPEPMPEKPVTHAEVASPNPPLKFRLEKLETDHPYILERGLMPETIEEFGIGFCRKGSMADRIAIPIHNTDGAVVAYAGRFPGETPGDAPKYKLPQGFRGSQELFNLHRALKASKDKPWVIVKGFFDCMVLHQRGARKIVGLMGDTMSPTQVELIRRHTERHSRVILMLEEDETGRSIRDEIAARLAKFVFVRIHVFERQGQGPEDLSVEEVEALFA